MLVQFLKQTEPLRRLPVWLAYSLAILVVLVFTGLRIAVGNLDKSINLPLFLLFVPAVILTSLLFGRGSGIFATILSGAIGLYYFIEPVGALKYYNLGEFVRFIAFMIIGVFTAILVETLNSAIRELDETRTRLLKTNKHRDLLLADINHRVKNHLGSLSAALSLSKRKVQDEEALEVIDATVSRITVLGEAYTRLHIVNEDVTLDAKDYLQGLCDDLSSSLLASRPIELRTDLDVLDLDTQSAVSLGLIANELINNAIKYAFPDDRAGTISLSFKCDSQFCVFEVADDGVGMSEGKARSGIGTRLIASLVAQLDGTISRHMQSGTRVRITIPLATDQRKFKCAVDHSNPRD